MSVHDKDFEIIPSKVWWIVSLFQHKNWQHTPKKQNDNQKKKKSPKQRLLSLQYRKAWFQNKDGDRGDICSNLFT